MCNSVNRICIINFKRSTYTYIYDFNLLSLLDHWLYSCLLKHFKKEDFRWTLNRKCLKADVVPSVFEWKDDFMPRKPPKVRLPLPTKNIAITIMDQLQNEEEGNCEDHTLQTDTDVMDENQYVFYLCLLCIKLDA